MGRLALIVSADDYGLTAGTNRGIERAHSEGVVTSTNVMVNQMAAEDVAELGTRCPDLGVGIHLTLTLGEPVSDPARVPSLIDTDGHLLDRATLWDRARRGRVEAGEVAEECSAQLARLRLLGVEPDHWNAHHHVHEQAAIGEPMAATMAREGVRITRNPIRLLTRSVLTPRGALATVRGVRRRRARRRIARWAQMPLALLDTDPTRWAGLVGSLPAGIVEAVSHPGEPDAALARLTPALAEPRGEELAAIVRTPLRETVHARDGRLTSFRQAFAHD